MEKFINNPELKKYEYYRTENGVLYCGDCLEVMRLMPDKSVDLVLTDPPYGIKIAKDGVVGISNKAQARIYDKVEWDKKPLPRVYFEEIFRISSNQLIFGANYYARYLPNGYGWLVWDKQRPDGTVFSDAELIFASFNNLVKTYRILWHGMIRESKEPIHHPTQKPLKLIERLLVDYSQLGDLILDPFLGSGTTAHACERLGRKWIGIEINPDYCEIAKKRIEVEARQIKLFV